MHLQVYSTNVMVSDAAMTKGKVSSFLSVDAREDVSLTSGACHLPQVMTPLQAPRAIGFFTRNQKPKEAKEPR